VSTGAGSEPMVTCPACGEVGFADELYCEACGAPLPAAGPAAAPGTPPSSVPAGPTPVTVSEAPTPPWPPAPMSPPWGTPAHPWAAQAPKARREIVDGPVAAVTDRGVTHWRNEDAVGLRWVAGSADRPSGFVMVVCDGVSLSQEPQLVSQAAVDTALLVLSGAVSAGGDLDAAMVEATAAAQRAASSTPYNPSLELGPGACTFVAVAVRGRRATFASVGDSRAYWVESSGVYQVGRDDSLAAELVASGGYTHAQAMATSGAHALTKWLGVDSVDAHPTLTSVELPGPGMVILASDGLWNYAPEPADLAHVIGPVGAEGALDLARRLADFATVSGGNDNITVAVGPHQLGPHGPAPGSGVY
jgi:PPM family protein phosphatase